MLGEMQASIREDFGGIESSYHREDLIKRLDHVLGGLDRGWEHIERHRLGINQYQLRRAKMDYRTLREVLLGVERNHTGEQTCF